jgi:hypothetical protein
MTDVMTERRRVRGGTAAGGVPDDPRGSERAVWDSVL